MSEMEEGAFFEAEDYEYKKQIHETMEKIIQKIQSENYYPVFPFVGENGNPVFELKLHLGGVGRDEHIIRVYGEVGADGTWEKGEIYTIIMYRPDDEDEFGEYWLMDLSEDMNNERLEFLENYLNTHPISDISMLNPDPDDDDLILSYNDKLTEAGATSKYITCDINGYTIKKI